MKKYYDARIDACQIRLDNARHNYLHELTYKINKMTNIKNIDINIKKIYHYSVNKMDKDGYIPFFGKVTYKNYWNGIRNDYLKKLTRDNLEIVKNSSLYELIYRTYNKDKHKIKWKEIEKNNNHYVICFINGFETVIVHDMINGIPYPILVEDYSKGTEILIQCKILTRTSFVVDYVEINGKSYGVDSFMEKLYKNYRK